MRKRCVSVKGSQMATAVLSLGLLGVSPAPASPVLCQTLHAAVQPALTGLLKNDNLLEQANQAAAKRDHLGLGSYTHSVSANLNVVATLLVHGFPHDDDSAASAYEDLIKKRLEAIAAAQGDAVNIIEVYQQSQDVGQDHDEFAGKYGEARGYHEPFDTANDPTAAVAKPDGTGDLVAVLTATRSRISNLEEPAGMAIMAAQQACSSQKP